MHSMAKGRSQDRERRIDRINWMECAETVPREMNTVLLPVGTLGVPGGHAGADETAAMLAIAPDQVFPERWDPSLAFEHRDSLAAFPAPGSLLYYGGKRSDPVLDERKAARFWERVVEHVGEVLEDLVARWNREGMSATQRRRVAE